MVIISLDGTYTIRVRATSPGRTQRPEVRGVSPAQGDTKNHDHREVMMYKRRLCASTVETTNLTVGTTARKWLDRST